MKLDMHCHTHEGSVDSKIGVEEYIRILKEKGYDGMLITDHDTYNGYRYWKEHLKGKKYKDFVVLKGIEYDTNNAGHMLVVMPENVKLRILEMRGMPLPMLLFIVHAFGGIVGPAHPFGEKYLSFTNTRYFRKNRNIVEKFDFIETFNSCENAERIFRPDSWRIFTTSPVSAAAIPTRRTVLAQPIPACLRMSPRNRNLSRWLKQKPQSPTEAVFTIRPRRIRSER